MKAIRVVTCALAACAVAASAASIEQTLDINVTGVFQGISTNSAANRNVELQRTQIFRINSGNIVRALAIERDTNYYNGTLIYRTALDGSVTNFVIRRAPFPDLDVTGSFHFTPGPFVVTQVSNTNSEPPLTTTRIETGLMALSFTSSSASFNTNTDNLAFSYGTSTRTHNPVSGRVKNSDGVVVPVSGYANLLSFSGGGALASFITNFYSLKTNQFAGTNFVTGPVQIQFRTFGPVVSANNPIPPPL